MQMVISAGTHSPDIELERRVHNFLAGRFLPALKRLAIEADGGVVTVRGQVSSFYEKQVALHCCQRVAGVRELIDAVDVESPMLAALTPSATAR
jgi:osmotically-inducible protein OsmY